ncbi:MAG: ATP-binding protein [Prosthecobacter sp.]
MRRGGPRGRPHRPGRRPRHRRNRPPPHLRAFDRADQARTSTSGHTGLGLGLAITKAIVENHGGSVRVSSRVGEGGGV